MKTTLFGVIEVEPQQLEDGIGIELVYRMARALNSNLKFSNAQRDLETVLINIGDYLGAFQQSFEHIQDYIKVYGLKVLQEEFTRIINYYVEQESNRFLRRKIYDDQSQYQSESIPIPPFGIRTFHLVLQGFGVVGLDKLVAFVISKIWEHTSGLAFIFCFG